MCQDGKPACRKEIKGISYEICSKCGKPIRNSGLSLGAMCAFVVKNFVRAGRIVDFTGDWRRLMESCGFEVVRVVHASLVKESRHPSLFGEEIVEKTERKSFFRRLHEKKRPDLAIDYEVVLFARRIP